ncbi:zinc finger protein 260-like [Ostrinia nubilalis]|uniref:zinc finger protein 260-like n=1 Tax=Ostrinia nubilalis TaxID=29057 RepID=UPI00308236F3
MENPIDESDPNYMEYALKRSLLSRNKLAIILKGPDGDTEYCCVECPVKYKDIEQLQLHLCVHTKQYRFLCRICGTGLKRKEHLDRHTLEHQELRPHKCEDCGKAFKRREHLNIHLTIHKDDKTYECSLCNRSFHRKDHLQKHLQVHSKVFESHNLHPMSDQELEAQVKEEVKEEICDEEIYDDEGNPIKEEESYGDYEMQEYEAEDPDNCEYNSDSQLHSSPVEPSIEIRTPDSGTGRPYVCNICYKSYKRKDHLKIHSWTHMKKDKQCTGCFKAFHTDSQLVSHMQSCMLVHISQYRGDDAPGQEADLETEEMILPEDPLLEVRVPKLDVALRPHECVVCHRRFKRKQHLKVHANVHLKQEASIWCSLCSQGFITNQQFEKHDCTANATPEGQEGSQQPQEAKKENKSPADYLVQEMTEKGPDDASYLIVQDEQNIPTPQRVFVCRFCQKPFKRRDHYKIHLHIHTGVKSFFCPDCGKGFYRKDHLQKHSQTHKNKPKPKKQLPELLPLSRPATREVKPEITIHAPSNSKLRVPLQIKVPYQMVVSDAAGARRTVTVDPQRREVLT